MKSKILILAFFSFGYSTIAQDVNFGIKAGVNFASITDVSGFDFDSRTVFHAGLVAELPITAVFSIQPELLLSLQGYKEDAGFDFGPNAISVEEKLKLAYLTVPIMGKYYLTRGLSLEAGPQAGFLLDSKFEIESNQDNFEEDANDLIENFDFSVNFGLGYKFLNGFNLAARYNLGLTDVFEDSFEDSNAQNSVFQLSLGYFF